MRIHELRVAGFGCLHGFSMELDGGLNTLLRPNGWGKSTLSAFLKAMLYGLSKSRGGDSERKKYAPWQGGVFGGSMVFSCEKGKFRVERFFGARESADRFALYDLSTNLESNAFSTHLGEELFGIDAEGFARTVFLSGKGSASGGEGLAARLAALVEAADDAGDFDAAEATLEKRSRYYLTTGNRGQIPTLRAELISREREMEELLRERAALDDRRRAARTHADALADTEEGLARIREEKRTAAEARQRNALSHQRRELVGRRARLLSRVKTLDAESRGLHPDREMTRRARASCAAVERLQAQKPQERVSGGGGATGLSVAMLLVGAVLGVLGLVLSLVPLALIGGGAATVALVLLFLHAGKAKRARTEERQRTKEWEAQLSLAVRAREKALRAIGVTDAEKIATVEEREVEYTLLCTELKEASEALSRFDALHPSVSHATAETDSTEVLDAREEELCKQADELRTRIAEENAAAERLMLRTEALPDLEAAILSLRLELAEAERAHEALTVALMHLRAAKESLSTRYLSHMAERMRDYVALLTADAPDPIPDATLSLSVGTDTGTHPLSQMSQGWQDLFDFAARLSLCDVLFAQTERPILILDDPFANLDDDRLHRAKLLLSRLSESYQILYTVCQSERG